MVRPLFMERINLYWQIQRDRIHRWRKSRTVLLSISFEKEQQGMSGGLLILSLMKIHLIFWPNVFLQGRNEESLVADYCIICILRRLRSSAPKVDVGWMEWSYLNHLFYVYIYVLILILVLDFWFERERLNYWCRVMFLFLEYISAEFCVLVQLPVVDADLTQRSNLGDTA